MELSVHTCRNLWAAYREKPEPANRNRLIEFYLPWIRKTASSLFLKYHTPYLEWSDYVSCATLECICGVERFNSKALVPFEAYIYPRVKGACLDLIKSHTEGLGAAAVCIEDIAERADAQALHGDAFERTSDAVMNLALGYILEYATLRQDNHNPEHQLYSSDRSDRIVAMVEELPFMQRMVIKAHYLQYLKFADIAEQLDLTKARVSQIHQLGLATLRHRYAVKG